MIRHIVWWTLKPEAEGRCAAENAVIIKRQGEALLGKVPGLNSLELSIRMEEGTTEDCGLVLCSTHDDMAALQAYLEHPLHQELSDLIGACRLTRRAINYEI